MQLHGVWTGIGAFALPVIRVSLSESVSTMARLCSFVCLLAVVSLSQATTLRLKTGETVRIHEASQLRGGAAVEPIGLAALDGMKYPEFVSRKDRDYAAGVQRLSFATGTDVIVYGDKRLTHEEMFRVAEHVVPLTKGKVMRCFCRFMLANVGAKLTKSQKQSTNGDQANINCACSGIGPGASAALDGPPPKPKDFYGSVLEHNGTLTERLRYPLPAPTVFELPTEGMILSLDAGDKKSYDPKNPSIWKDASESEDPVAKTPAEIYGFVGFSDSEGGGALRLGAHDDRDFIVVKNLDISPIKMPEVSVEIWVKLQGIRHARGRAFGNVLSGFGGRALNLHDTRYGPKFSEHVPSFQVNPSFCAKNGRIAMTAGHRFDSKIEPPSRDEWTQLVATWDKVGVATLYINGKWKDQQTTFSDGDEVQSQGSKDFTIGNHQFDHKGGLFKLDAYVGLVRVFDRAVKVDEVNSLYEHSKNRFGHLD